MKLEAFPDFHAAVTPDKPAYVMAEAGTVVTYRTLVDRTRQAARLMRSLGVRTGDGAAIVMENHLRYLEVVWALQRCGAQYAPISSRLRAPEVAYIIDDAAAEVLFTSAQLADVALEAAELSKSRPRILCVDPPPQGLLDYEALVAQQSTEPIGDELEGFDLLYSSGTTGRPKGIEQVYSPSPLGTAPRMEVILAERWDLDEDTVYLSPAPLYHSAPMRFNITTGRFGGSVVVMEKFDAEAYLRAVETYKVTHSQVVPTMFIRMLKLPEEVRSKYDLSSLRCVVHAAAPCPPDVKVAMIEWLGPIIFEYYGTTERNLYTTIDPDEALARPGSVGKPLVGIPHILDDDGNELPIGETGTIWSEGGLDFAYHNDPQKTAAAYNDRGWTTVGDLGRVDEDGYLYLTDRRSDLILSGGVNIYPQEAENVLVTHPEVYDAAVFGVPNPEMGEEVKAVVQPADPAQAGPELEQRLIDHCRSQLAPFKCPRSIDFRDQLPRHPTGKLYKRLLRDEYAAKAQEAETA